MPVKEADPNAKALTDAFAEAMGAPARPAEPPAPKPVDPEAPHGRDDDGKPLAPHGYTKDGKVRKSAAGRPSLDDKPRLGKPEPGGKPDDKGGEPAAELAEPGQYTQQLSDTADSLWFGLTALSKVAPRIPLIGPRLPAERLNAQAAVWYATKDRAVAAISLAAEHNAAAARFARKLEGGDVTWIITCMSLIAPVLELSAMVWAKDADERLAANDQPSLAELAKKNDAAMDAAVAKMLAQAEEQAAEEQAASIGQAA